MGTPKRERQKANRQQRLEDLARQARTVKRKRTGMYVLLIPIAALALIAVIKLVGSDDTPAASATTTIDPFASSTLAGPTTTIDPNAPTTTLTPLPSTIAGATLTADTPCPAADGSSARTIIFAKAPPNCIDATKTYTAEVTTNKGAYTIELDPVIAPINVNNFVVLARYHYFDNTICHRIIPAFAVQCGDPTGSGSGGPGYSIADELPAAGAYKVGSLAMANSSQPDTGGSQFFVITGEEGVQLSPDYSLFGQVTDGLDTTVKALDAVGNPDRTANGIPPLEQVVIESVIITEA